MRNVHRLDIGSTTFWGGYTAMMDDWIRDRFLCTFTKLRHLRVSCGGYADHDLPMTFFRALCNSARTLESLEMDECDLVFNYGGRPSVLFDHVAYDPNTGLERYDKMCELRKLSQLPEEGIFFPNLRKIKIKMNSNTGTDTIVQMLQGGGGTTAGKLITELDFENSSVISRDDDLGKILEHTPELRVLRAVGSGIGGFEAHVDAEGFPQRQLCTLVPLLTTLDLENMPTCDAGLHRLFVQGGSLSKSLLHLSLHLANIPPPDEDGCSHPPPPVITPHGLGSAVSNLTKLECLKLRVSGKNVATRKCFIDYAQQQREGSRGGAYGAFGDKLPRLRSVELDLPLAVPLDLADLSRVSNLESLVLHSSCLSVENFSTRGVMAVATTLLVHLRQLAQRMIADGLEQLACRTRTHLRRLVLVRPSVGVLHDDLLAKLVDAFGGRAGGSCEPAQLESLCVLVSRPRRSDPILNITDQLLAKIATSLPELRSLRFGSVGLDRVTEAGFSALAQGCKKLERLILTAEDTRTNDVAADNSSNANDDDDHDDHDDALFNVDKTKPSNNKSLFLSDKMLLALMFHGGCFGKRLEHVVLDAGKLGKSKARDSTSLTRKAVDEFRRSLVGRLYIAESRTTYDIDSDSD